MKLGGGGTPLIPALVRWISVSLRPANDSFSVTALAVPELQMTVPGQPGLLQKNNCLEKHKTNKQANKKPHTHKKN